MRKELFLLFYAVLIMVMYVLTSISLISLVVVSYFDAI